MSKRDLFKNIDRLGRADNNSGPSVAEVMLTQQAPPSQASKFKVAKAETKSSHMHILIRPSTKAKLDAIAKAEGISTNELINEILEYTIKEC